MTFPLLTRLRLRYPENPILFAAEEAFYKDLKPLVPGVQFLPRSSLPRLAEGKYEMVINLDSRPEAAMCAAKAMADLKIGHLLQDDGVERVEGFWQLYRASLTANNRHNLFHWGDLNRLDLDWPLPALNNPGPVKTATSRIGLFIGASEAAKRPEPDFWIAFARHFLAAGLKPVILGGPGEKEAGEHIARRANLEKANFCGKTNLAQLIALLRGLDLLVTPDTGPMHLADWLGARVLNLSMGNVQAWETGPMREGQLVMRAGMSCAGCWRCSRGKLYCARTFNPSLTARIALKFLNNDLAGLPSPGTELLLSGRDENGLYTLSPLVQGRLARSALDSFWQSAFLLFDNKLSHEAAAQKARKLAAFSPALAQSMRKNAKKLLSCLLLGARGKFPAGVWKSFPRGMSLFAGFIEMSLQNESFSKEALNTAIARTGLIGELFAASA